MSYGVCLGSSTSFTGPTVSGVTCLYVDVVGRLRLFSFLSIVSVFRGVWYGSRVSKGLTQGTLGGIPKSPLLYFYGLPFPLE